MGGLVLLGVLLGSSSQRGDKWTQRTSLAARKKLIHTI